MNVQHLDRCLSAARSLAWVCAFVAIPSAAQIAPPQLPLIAIGASYSEGATPFNNGTAPLGGVAVSFGSYRSLGVALTRQSTLPGHVVNEARPRKLCCHRWPPQLHRL
jgi:hypothetical protein